MWLLACVSCCAGATRSRQRPPWRAPGRDAGRGLGCVADRAQPWARGPELHTATEGARTRRALPEAHAACVTGSRAWRMLYKMPRSWRDSRPCHRSPTRCRAGPWVFVLARAQCGALAAPFGGGGVGGPELLRLEVRGLDPITCLPSPRPSRGPLRWASSASADVSSVATRFPAVLSAAPPGRGRAATGSRPRLARC